MLTSLLYISRSKIAPDDAEVIVKQIVAAAIVANQARSLTGALLFTGTHFAQVIEGRDKDIEALFAILARDPRHDQLTVVDRAPLAERRFESWSMGYFGPSQFIARHVTRLLNDPSPAEKSRAAIWLTELMEEFSQT
jgi:hypothetical protein